MSDEHYILIGINLRLVAMKVIRIGDIVHTVSRGGFGNGVIEKVDLVWDYGLFNQTISGDIVVKGIRASCYTQAVGCKPCYKSCTPDSFACRRMLNATVSVERVCSRSSLL